MYRLGINDAQPVHFCKLCALPKMRVGFPPGQWQMAAPLGTGLHHLLKGGTLRSHVCSYLCRYLYIAPHYTKPCRPVVNCILMCCGSSRKRTVPKAHGQRIAQERWHSSTNIKWTSTDFGSWSRSSHFLQNLAISSPSLLLWSTSYKRAIRNNIGGSVGSVGIHPTSYMIATLECAWALDHFTSYLRYTLFDTTCWY